MNVYAFKHLYQYAYQYKVAEFIRIYGTIQHLRMIEDIEKHRNKPYSGCYRGIPWELKRPYGTYLCGYIRPPPAICPRLTDAHYDELEKIAHGGLTSGLGFDCAHYGDYFVIGDVFERYNKMSMSGIYRDYDYCLPILYNMIDYIKNR